MIYNTGTGVHDKPAQTCAKAQLYGDSRVIPGGYSYRSTVLLEMMRTAPGKTHTEEAQAATGIPWGMDNTGALCNGSLEAAVQCRIGMSTPMG